MAFQPDNPPVANSHEEVLQWVFEQLQRFSTSLSDTKALELRTTNAEPDRPREGTIVQADGTDWDPGNGQGTYVYQNGMWVPMSLGSPVPIASGGTGATTAAAAFDNLKQAATSSYQGVAELATNAETRTGTDTGRVLTPDDGAAVFVRNPVGIVSFSAASTVDIVLTSYTAAGAIGIIFQCVPATDATHLYMRMSTNGGSSYDAASGDYSWSYGTSSNTAGSTFGGSGSDSGGNTTEIRLNDSIGNQSTEGIIAQILLVRQTSTALWSKCMFHTEMTSSLASQQTFWSLGGGARKAAQDTDAIRFLMSSGNMTGQYQIFTYP